MMVKNIYTFAQSQFPHSTIFICFILNINFHSSNYDFNDNVIKFTTIKLTSHKGLIPDLKTCKSECPVNSLGRTR